ncbi:hypothetical protein VCHA49P380_20213 [Vibrio chagasii]|nr:hypothetical protein VCHA49P380_20213 [Vibrio chagasii]
MLPLPKDASNTPNQEKHAHLKIRHTTKRSTDITIGYTYQIGITLKE